MFFLLIIFSLLFSILYLKKSKIDISQSNIIGEITQKENDNKYIVKIKNEYLIVYSKNNYHGGDKVSFNGKLTRISNFSDFDYETYLKSKRIYYSFVSNNDNKISTNYDIYYLRYKIKDYYDSKFEGSTRSYFNSLILGNKIDDSNIKENVNNLGISYLFVISGFHISMLVLILDKILSIRNKTPLIKDIIILVLVFIYCLIIGFSVGVSRAFLAYLINKLNIHKGYNLTSLDKLSINFLILNFINPLYIFQTSFKFSFITTLFLILSEKIVKDTNILKKYYKQSFICFFASIPLIININYSINLLTIFTGPILLIILTFIIMPILYMLVFIPFNIFNVFLLKYQNIIDDLSNYKLFIINFKEINPIFIMIYYILFLIALSSIEEKKNYINASFVFVFLFFLYSIKYIYPFTTLSMINVGQGDSFIIRDKNNILAVDSYSSNINYIKSAGIDHIDVLCLTHSDNDHISSALDLVSDIKVDCLVLNYYENSDEIKRIEHKVNKVIRVKKGDDFSFGKNNCHVIGPKNKYKEVNNNSLVFITTVGSKRILFTGDMEKEEEEDIFDKKIFVDIIKIPHHGSDTSMSNNVIKNVSFNTCLISCGKYNKYNHPSSLTLDKLKNKNVYISYNTGSITFDLNSNIIIKKRDFRFYLNCLDCLTKEIY